jgi:CheY-like chemotaxis protein
MTTLTKTSSPDQLQDLNSLSRNVLNILLGIISLLGTVSVVVLFLRALTGNGDMTAAIVYAVADLLAVTLFFARRIPERVRALVFLIALYAFSFYVLRIGWLAGGGRVFLLAFIVCAALLLEPRSGFLATLLSLVTFFGFGVAFYQGWLTMSPVSSPTQASTVIVEGAGFIVVVGIVALGLWFVGRALAVAARAIQEAQETRQLLTRRAEELDQANQLLAERSASTELARQQADQARQAIEGEAWQSHALAALSQAASGEQELAQLAANTIRQICLALEAPVGALFIAHEDGRLHLLGSHAYTQRKHAINDFALGEGLIGQAALEKKSFTLTRVPADYLPIQAGLVQITPSQLVVAPVLFEDQVIGVIELGLLHALTPAQADYLPQALQSVAVAFHTARTRSQINALLRQTQEQATSLQAREEALRAINEELHTQAESLRTSQDQLRRQQDALQATNAELEEQRHVLDQQNQSLTLAQGELQRKADELAQANQYKSEFLANMSHELRTPLNSLLILARILTSNEEGNLTADQVESARIIHQSGSDLLSLINEILDLSKVEAGRMTFHITDMPLTDLVQGMRSQFEHMAEQKGLTFEVSLAANLPASIPTDQQRVGQIVKNLLSNAFKFTEKGTVALLLEPELDMVAIRVRDSGIGMTAEQQERVFQAFQQADGSTSRKYGGTGLGLTISRELATRLGGRIGVESQLGKGSTFTLYLPVKEAIRGDQRQATRDQEIVTGNSERGLPRQAKSDQEISNSPKPSSTHPVTPSPALPITTPALPDDRDKIQKGDKLLLVIEDDAKFAKILADYAHQKGFKVLLAASGEDGLGLVCQYPPDAILLDLNLPGMTGWQVLDELKNDASLRHIPVHILSAQEETLDAFKRGALGFLSKPVSPEGLESVFQKIGGFLDRDIKTLLLIEDDQALRHSVRQLLGGSDVAISEAVNGQAALNLLHSQAFDCVILDLSLPDMSGFELLNQINADPAIPKCPVIVYTGQDLSTQENAELLTYADSVIIKGVKSPERLLDEAALFLHRVVADMPEEKQRTIQRLYSPNAAFSDKHVLVVDDDMRNAFALSRLLVGKGLKASIARSGAKALEMLNEPPNDNPIDLVLMDIMMPEMDGYETMQRIRAQARFRNLPILALTAKAMVGDREKCLSAGASDYLSKPVDADRLFSMLRVWLYR